MAYKLNDQKDWRKEGQNIEKRNVIKKLGKGANLAGFVSALGALFFGRISGFLFVACVLTLMISLALYLVYPQYFTIMETKAFNRVKTKAKMYNINTAVILPALALILCTILKFQFTSWMPILIFGLAGGIIISFLMYILSRELRENRSFFISFVLMSVAVSGALAGQINHMANLDAAAPQVCVVVETEQRGSGRSKHYYCRVETDAGSELRLPVGMIDYVRLKPGESVMVYKGQGALSIEYSYLVGISTET